jgi:hypothetical protein
MCIGSSKAKINLTPLQVIAHAANFDDLREQVVMWFCPLHQLMA